MFERVRPRLSIPNVVTDLSIVLAVLAAIGASTGNVVPLPC